MHPVQPIQTVELFPRLSRELNKVLTSLNKEQWNQPTACVLWSVKDVATHLLGGSLGRLAEQEDRPSQAEKNELSFEELVRLIDQENEAWVKAARRISPSLLIEFLDIADTALYMYFKTMPMDGIARTPVSWAGEAESPNWMDIAREYTEKWLHQQHIREAVGEPLLNSRKWLFPVLDTFMQALPFTYRNVDAEEGTCVTVRIEGEAGGDWCLSRQEGKWRLYTGVRMDAVTHVEMGQNLAWRLFTKGISVDAARSEVRIQGEWKLGESILQMVSIMA
jgi:uncharacterized protein (TIGR03083 family)